MHPTIIDTRVRTRRTDPAMIACLFFAAALAPAFGVRADPLNPLDFPSLGVQTIAAGSYTIDTGATPPTFGALTGTVSPSGIAVFRFDDLTVNTGASITLSAGPGKRPIAFLSAGNLNFAGSIAARGNVGTNGGPGGAVGGVPGAGSGGYGGGGGAAGSPGGFGHSGGGVGGGVGAVLFSQGGGGGGFGGAGGSANGNYGGVNGVQPNFQLSGGSGGGGGNGGFSGGAGGGGGGGGAIELGALGTLAITGTASINVDGGAGGTGVNPAYSGGGGSGGSILLHGRSVNFGTLGAAISASGGAGGGGGSAAGGGGGRIAILSSVNNGATGISVAGGPGIPPGAAGVMTLLQPTLTPTSLDFGSVPVGSSVTLNMIIQNTGQAGSFISGQFPAASAPFARVGTGIFSGLGPGQYAACPYTFSPGSVGGSVQGLPFLSDGGSPIVSISGVGISTAPANDNCAAAIRIGDGARTFSTVGATTDGPTEANLGFCCNDLQVNQDVWFLYTASCTGTASVSLCGSTYDSKVAVYAGASCPSAPSTAIAGNDDYGPCGGTGTQSYTTFACTAGSQYLIRVGGYAAGQGTVQFSVGCAASGACCRGAACTLTLGAAACTGGAPPGFYLGDGSVCTPIARGGPVNACCKVDINNSGIVSVQDIFDFLAAYFVGCP